MINEIGHYVLVLALGVGLIVSTLPVIGARRNDRALMDIASLGSVMMFLLVGFSFAALTRAYAVSDFSVRNVWENSHSLMPVLYKLTGVWGNHEGSMLLWLLILVFFSALVAAFGRNLPETLKANVLAVQAWISVAFLLFILLTSNPFLRLERVPAEGRTSIPSFRISASPSIRRCSISVMSVFPSASPLPSQHSWKVVSTPPGRAG